MENNDAAYLGRGSDQKPNGSVNLTDESNDLENNDIELPSNGFSPVSYYGPRKQIFTARIKLFSPSAHKKLTDEDEVLLPKKDSPGVKRKNKRQRSSSTMKKKRRTCNAARQCKTSGNKQKLASISNENCSYMFEKESLVSKPSGVDAVIKNEDETDLFATTADGSSPHECRWFGL